MTKSSSQVHPPAGHFIGLAAGNPSPVLPKATGTLQTGL
jgi:hypothetical protein